MICVSYTRTTSSLVEKETAPDIIRWQNERIEEYAKQKGWIISKKYSDRKAERKADAGFQQLKEDGMQRKFDMVIMYSVFRAGRGVPYAEDVLRKTFYALGIQFVFVDEEFESTNYSDAELKAYFRKKKYKAAHSVGGEQRKQDFLNGYFTVHDEKYGYFLSSDLRTFTIDEEAADVVRQIFDFVIENKTYAWIAKYLNEQGIESPIQRKNRLGMKNVGNKIGPWSLCSVKNIALNRVYTGKCTKRFKDDIFTYEIPAVISEETFEKAQEVLKEKHISKGGNTTFRNPFAMFIIDKGTGQSLTINKAKSKNNERVFCLDNERYGRNEVPSISLDTVMAAVVHAIRKEQALAAKIRRKIEKGDADTYLAEIEGEYRGKAKKLFAQMSEIEKPYIPLYCQYEQGEVSEPEYEISRREIVAELEKIEERFRAMMDEYERKKKTFSLENSWMKYYMDAEIPDVLTASEFRKWAVRIEVENFEKVYVIFKHEEWRDSLPEEWLNGGN